LKTNAIPTDLPQGTRKKTATPSAVCGWCKKNATTSCPLLSNSANTKGTAKRGGGVDSKVKKRRSKPLQKSPEPHPLRASKGGNTRNGEGPRKEMGELQSEHRRITKFKQKGS